MCTLSQVETEEVKKRREWLRYRAREREYQKMVSNVEHPKYMRVLRQRPGYNVERRSVMADAGIGLNMILAALTAFVLGYFVGKAYFGGIQGAAFTGLFAMMVRPLLHCVRRAARGVAREVRWTV